MRNLLIILSLTILLSACSSDQAESPASAEQPQLEASLPAAESVADPIDLARRDPEALREAMRDPAQREVLIERMRERRGQLGEDGRLAEREAMRETMRERRAEMTDGTDTEAREERLRQRQLRGAAEWWTDSQMAESLGLSQDQQQGLSASHQQIEAERTQLRQALASTQRDLLMAVRSGERAQIETLLEQRSAAIQSNSELETRWQRQLLATLDDDQLRQLATHNPQILMGRARTP